MEKNFNKWNEIKKKIDAKEKRIFCKSREIWWSYLGINVGSETDGKGEFFERPVLVLKVFKNFTVRVAPLTSKPKPYIHHFAVFYNDREGMALLSEIKTISIKRLSRKMCRLDIKQFEEMVRFIKESIV